MSHYHYYQTETQFLDQEKKQRKKQFRKYKSRSQKASKYSSETINTYFKTKKIPSFHVTSFRLVTKLNNHWLKICGPILYPYLRIYELQGTQLTLIAQSGIWLQQARFLERELIKKIKLILPEINLEKIAIKVQYFQTKKTKSTKESKLPPRQKSDHIQINKNEIQDDIGKMSLKQKMQYMIDKANEPEN
ncbi:MAG: DUF721 domain-containing protein [Candidatus Cloacimonetes bacterium]|nr:DUF721 domain-containing protein [Candidatus Cloacimonadota bacterium]